MEWNEERVAIGSRLPSRLRLELDLERRRRGMKLEAALEEAVCLWLHTEPPPKPDPGPFGKLSRHEEGLVRCVLEYVRGGKAGG